MIRFAWLLFTGTLMTAYQGGKVIVAALCRVRYRPGGVYDSACRNWGRLLLRLNGLPLRAVGLERFPHDRPCVFASNHQSLVDIWALLAAIPQNFRFVAKRELLNLPIFGQAMRAAGHISIDRHNLDSAMASYDGAAEAMHGGMSAGVFVEGTRSRTGELLPFKKGPFVLAIRAGVPVVPVYVHGSYAILPRGVHPVRPGPVTVLFGDPIDTTGMTYHDRDALSDRCRAAMLALRAGAAGVDAPPAGG